MRNPIIPAVSVLVMSLAGCGNDGNPPAQVAVLSQEQIKAEEKHQQDVSVAERKHEELLPKAAYVSREEAVVNEAERTHEAALHARPAPPQKR